SSLEFARSIQRLLDETLPGVRSVVSVEHEGRYLIQMDGPDARARRIPLKVAGRHVASLAVHLYQELDRTGEFLKTSRTDFSVHSTLERKPLLRLEYDASTNRAPVGHWQIHAERGAFTHLLTLGHSTGRVDKPTDLSALHFPVGGERFRPSLEDLLEFLIRDCGVDSVSGWQNAVAEGRERWRRLQLRAVVRDLQEDAAAVLRDYGWHVEYQG